MWIGWAFFAGFVLLFYLAAPHSEASLMTQAIVFIGLIPPPVCFAGGIGLAFFREERQKWTGAWANTAAIFVHGLAVIVILQTSLA
ncbi:MAG: hypothetical protein ACXW2P_06085 [Thermoanaerobaculia bacterium]